MIRIIISDEFGQHGTDVRTSICNGYGSNISPTIQIVPYFGSAYYETQNNPDVIAFIRSTTGIAVYVATLGLIYPRVQSFFPMGTNAFVQMSIFATSAPPVVIPSGAGDFIATAQDRNNTGYGNGLEFWDRDLAIDDGVDQSSFSNGYVLGKLLYIKDQLSCSWWEARYRARITAYQSEPNRVTSPWDLYNGYGRIQVGSAIAFSGTIDVDPYTNPLGTTLGSFEIVDTNGIFKMFKIEQQSFTGVV